MNVRYAVKWGIEKIRRQHWDATSYVILPIRVSGGKNIVDTSKSAALYSGALGPLLVSFELLPSDGNWFPFDMHARAPARPRGRRRWR